MMLTHARAGDVLIRRGDLCRVVVLAAFTMTDRQSGENVRAVDYALDGAADDLRFRMLATEDADQWERVTDLEGAEQ